MTWYLISAIAVAGLVTFGLRALPFAVLGPLRRSRFVRTLGQWMPAGIVLILAVVVLRDEIVARADSWWMACLALGVTIAVHLFAGRRILLSIAAGTGTYIALVNLF